MKNKIFINAITSLVQVLIGTIVYFVLYKYLINTIGIDQLGIWSLILSSTSILNISNMGFSSSVIKYVAKYKALENPEKITKIIQTSLISVTVISGLVLLILIPFANLILKFIVPINYLNISKAILPYSLFSLWINIQSGIFAATLDGFQRIEIKNIILISGALLYLILSFILVPVYGLFGVVYAQLLQVTIILITNLVLVKVVFPEFPIKKFHWDVVTFKEIYSYSIKFQGITITQMLYDPITKSLLTKYGGLSATGYYEMASRLVLKIRELIVSVFHVLVPVYATHIEKDNNQIKSTYILSFNYMIFLSTPLFVFLMLATPLISIILLDSFDYYFIIFTLILSAAWLINIFNVPAYFAYQGMGYLKWNLFSHLTIGILNLSLCYTLGLLFGSLGTVIGWALALSLGSLIIIHNFNLSHNLNLISIISKENKIALLFGFSFVIISFFFQYIYFNEQNFFYINIGVILFGLMILLPFYWNHPFKKELYESFKLFLSLK